MGGSDLDTRHNRISGRISSKVSEMLKKSQSYKSTEIIDRRINDCQSRILDKNNFANKNKG
jgi:hypothetical protein